MAFRYGGEEFTVLFPRKGLQVTLPHLEHVRRTIGATPFKLRRFPRPRTKPEKPKTRKRAPNSLRITVSIGVAERCDRNPSPAEVIKAADKALYRAKRGGRDRVSQ